MEEKKAPSIHTISCGAEQYRIFRKTIKVSKELGISYFNGHTMYLKKYAFA
jgi:hypothetical protein